MNLIKRLKNLYHLSGIEVSDVSPKADIVGKLADVFKNPNVPKEPKRLASIIHLNEPDVETAE